ncbi:MAG: DUF3953 domain-containing protein [Oscillospiraceae bacterium]|nr:DUF3953 domain-containing protein [Oscillospiraceae bacterium]
MKTILTDWKEYNTIEKSAVIIQLIISMIVFVIAGLLIAGIINNNDILQILVSLLMIVQGVREWRRNRVIGVISFLVAVFIILSAVRIFLYRNSF